MSGNNAPYTVRCSESGFPAQTVITVGEYHPSRRAYVLAERGWSTPRSAGHFRVCAPPTLDRAKTDARLIEQEGNHHGCNQIHHI